MIRRSSVITLRKTWSYRAAMIPIKPLRVALHISSQRYILHRKRHRQHLESAEAVTRLQRRRMITHRGTLLRQAHQSSMILRRRLISRMRHRRNRSSNISPQRGSPREPLTILPPLPASLLHSVNVMSRQCSSSPRPQLRPRRRNCVWWYSSSRFHPLAALVRLKFLFISRDCETTLRIRRVICNRSALIHRHMLHDWRNTWNRTDAKIDVISRNSTVLKQIMHSNIST